MREDLKELLANTPEVRRALAKNFLKKSDPPEDANPPRPEEDRIVSSLFEKVWQADDLADGLRRTFEVQKTQSDREAAREVARLVLPQSKEARERLREWKKDLDGRMLVLPFGTHAKAEMALARLTDRPYREQVRDSRLTSEALLPVSQIRSSSKLAISSRHLIEEIAIYLATKVRFGPYRRKQGRPLYEDPEAAALDFTREGALEALLNEVNDNLRFHANAEDDDLLPMHLEIDDDGLSKRLEDVSDTLWDDLSKAFPRLRFVRLNSMAGPDTFFVRCLLKIFLR